MNLTILIKRTMFLIAIAGAILTLAMQARVQAQARGGAPQAAPAAKAAAPFDMTGNWVAQITDDWRWRMRTAQRGDYDIVELNQAGRRVMEAWDPAKDEAAGEQCRGYGAAGLMRLPTRLRITWENDNVLKIETDAGMQTRMFNFTGAPPAGERTWQGRSIAQWVFSGAARGGTRPGELRVVTNNMKPGYYFKNGIPYTENATMTEYFLLVKEANGDQYLLVTTTVDDPQYLTRSFIKTLQFKKEADGSKWNPTPCSAK